MHANNFSLRAGAGNKLHRILRYFQSFCQQADEFAVGSSGHWWGGNPNSQRAIVIADDLAARSARNYSNRESDTAIVCAELDHAGSIVNAKSKMVNESAATRRWQGVPACEVTRKMRMPPRETPQKKLTGQPCNRVAATAAWQIQMMRKATIGEISNIPTVGSERRSGASNGSVKRMRNRISRFA